MPFAVYVLGLAVFAQGTSEFMLSGLVEAIAADLHVSLAAAGSLTSAFAAGMIVGAPLVAALSRRWPRRSALLVFLVVFLLAHVVGALTTSFAVLLGTRVIAALANAGFLAVALVTAAGLAAHGRATSVLLGGVTLACVAGVPLGAVLGEVWGWRSAFWGIVLLTAPAVVAVLRSVPATPADPAAPGVRHELGALRSRRLIGTLLLGALVNGATFCSFTYLAPVVTGLAGLGSGWVPVALALFGLGSFAGVTVAGRLADRRPGLVPAVGGPAPAGIVGPAPAARWLLPAARWVLLAAGWVLLAASAAYPAMALSLIFVQGALSFGMGATLIAQAMTAAADAPTLAGGFATAALNVGAAAGPMLGGVALTAGLGLRSPLLVSAALVVAALTLSSFVSRGSIRR